MICLGILIQLQQVLIILLAYIIVRDTKYDFGTSCTLDGQHSIIEQ